GPLTGCPHRAQGRLPPGSKGRDLSRRRDRTGTTPSRSTAIGRSATCPAALRDGRLPRRVTPGAPPGTHVRPRRRCLLAPSVDGSARRSRRVEAMRGATAGESGLRSMKRHVGHLVALLALTVGLTASADVAPTTFVAESGPIDAFMTGVPLAVDGGDADANVDALALPASIDVAASEIPDGATLVRAFLFWGGTQSEDGSADPSVTLSSPGGGPTVIDADVCHASDA